MQLLSQLPTDIRVCYHSIYIRFVCAKAVVDNYEFISVEPVAVLLTVISTPLPPVLREALHTALVMRGMLVKASINAASRSIPAGTSSGVTAFAGAVVASHAMLLWDLLKLGLVAAVHVARGLLIALCGFADAGTNGLLHDRYNTNTSASLGFACEIRLMFMVLIR